MKLIVGLGNPGRRYKASRHNIGASVIKAAAENSRLLLKKDGIEAVTAKTDIGGEKVILAVPLSYMNCSGPAVASLLKRHRVDIEGVLVVCDDLDLEFGRLKIKPFGSSGGHKGLESVRGSLGTDRFCRLRLGIGRPPDAVEPAEYVLADFSRAEAKQLPAILEEAVSCCREWAADGIEKAMNLFNNFAR